MKSRANDFLLGMAMVFGFGAPMGNRLLDSKHFGEPGKPTLERDWKAVGDCFRAAMRSSEWQEREA